MESNLDLTRWQQAIEGIEAAQNDLSPDELSAFKALKELYDGNNFESSESDGYIQVIKNSLNRHGKNERLEISLINFAALCEKCFNMKVETPPAVEPPPVEPSVEVPEPPEPQIEIPVETPPAVEQPPVEPLVENPEISEPQIEAPVGTPPQEVAPEVKTDTSANAVKPGKEKPKVQKPNKNTKNTDSPRKKSRLVPIIIISGIVITLLALAAAGYFVFKDSDLFSKFFSKQKGQKESVLSEPVSDTTNDEIEPFDTEEELFTDDDMYDIPDTDQTIDLPESESTVTPPEEIKPEEKAPETKAETKPVKPENNRQEQISKPVEKKPTPPPVIENKPQDWNSLANNYFRQGNYVDAIECYKRVASNYPSTAVWNNMGICYQHLREYDNAIACFQKSNSIAGNGSAWYGLGKCYAEKKDRSKSIECLQKAAQLGHREAQDLLTGMNKKW